MDQKEIDNFFEGLVAASFMESWDPTFGEDDGVRVFAGSLDQDADAQDQD